MRVDSRRLREETGLRCAALEYVASVTYYDEVISPKHAHYWLMRVIADMPFEPNAEIDVRRWFDLAAAADVLTRPSDRDLLRRV